MRTRKWVPKPSPFAPECLTEDYELGLGIAALGGRSRFVRCRGANGRLVATRACFPDTLEGALRQKTRWVHGIAFQSWDRLGWRARPMDMWMRMRDRRGPLVALVLWLMSAAGDTWWLWAWGLWMGFNLLMLVLYPTVIAPLFNQFKPLDDPELQGRVQSLMQRCGFTAKGLFVMDGSKRSAHANAYFTGFGAAKRVVFFDTLLKQLSADEIDAVLAHELGHYKRRHIVKRVVLLFGLSFAGFALLGWAAGQAWFYSGLGVQPSMDQPNDALALILFMLAVPLLTYFLSPLMAQLSRRHEFEADAYAVAHTDGRDLASALLKLYKDNASTLTPDPVYARFYYSHPPASERLARLQAA